MQTWWNAPDFLGDRLPELRLAEYPIAGQIVRLVEGLVLRSRQYESLDYVFDIDEYERIAPGTNDNRASRFQPISHPREIDLISWSQHNARPDDNSGQSL